MQYLNTKINISEYMYFLSIYLSIDRSIERLIQSIVWTRTDTAALLRSAFAEFVRRSFVVRSFVVRSFVVRSFVRLFVRSLAHSLVG